MLFWIITGTFNMIEACVVTSIVITCCACGVWQEDKSIYGQNCNWEDETTGYHTSFHRENLPKSLVIGVAIGLLCYGIGFRVRTCARDMTYDVAYETVTRECEIIGKSNYEENPNGTYSFIVKDKDTKKVYSGELASKYCNFCVVDENEKPHIELVCVDCYSVNYKDGQVSNKKLLNTTISEATFYLPEETYVEALDSIGV